MSVDPHENAHLPAWWGRPVDQLGLSHIITIVLKHTGIIKCEDFLSWSEAELQAWAAENSVNLSPILRSLANEGISLAPNERPDQLVRLILAPTNHASREAAIDYYGLLGRKPRSLQEMGARDLTKKRLLERRLSQATPRLSTLSRLAPRLAVTIDEAASTGIRAPEDLALAIAPLLGEGLTQPVHFARLLMDLVSPRVAATAARSNQESGPGQVTPPAQVVTVHASGLEEQGSASPGWVNAPIEHLRLQAPTTRRLQQAGILRCVDLTSWTKEQLDFWATENGVQISSLERALAFHAIPLTASDQPDRLVRLLLSPLDQDQRQAVIEYWGLLDPAPESVQDLADIYIAWHGTTLVDRARSRLQRIKRLPLPLEPVMLTAANYLKSNPKELASAIAPLLGRGQTLPLHFADFLLRIVPFMRILPQLEVRRKTENHLEQELSTAATGQRAERTRAATELIDLLFNEDEA